MKRFFIFLCLLTGLSTAFAIQVSGPQTGTWSPDNNPYEVIGAISVPSGSNLNIQPGVLVQIMGSFQITVAGTMNANGTVTDSIRFVNMQANPTALWPGLRFENTTAASQLSYVYIEYGTYGVRSMNAHLSISHCRINRCEKGMELYAIGAPASLVLVEYNLIENCIQNGILITSNSGAHIANNEIRYNGTGSQFRAAIQLANQSAGGSCNPIIEYNHIHHNLKQGISAWDVSSSGAINPQITNNIIEYNYTGVYLLQTSGYVADNQINHNFIPGDMNSGAGVMVSGITSQPYFERNTITGNYTGFYITNNAMPVLGDLSINHAWAQGENVISANIDANGVEHSIFCAAYANAMNTIKAENNNWGVFTATEIAVGINDQNDVSTLPTVDFDPFIYPIPPTVLMGSYVYEGSSTISETRLQLISQASGSVIQEVMLLSSPYIVQAMLTEPFYAMILMFRAADNAPLYGCAGGFLNPTVYVPGDFNIVDLGTILVNDTPPPRYEIIGEPVWEDVIPLYPILHGFALYGWDKLEWVFVVDDFLELKRVVHRSPDGEVSTELPLGTIYRKFQNIMPDDVWTETRVTDLAGTIQTCEASYNPCSTWIGTTGYHLLTRQLGANHVLDKQIVSAGDNVLYRYENGYVIAKENILHLGAENPIAAYSTTLYVPQAPDFAPTMLAYNPTIFNPEMQVRLFWQAPAQQANNWTHYRIYRNNQLYASVPFGESQFTDTMLPPPEGYLYYRVCAWDGSQESDFTNEVVVINVANEDDLAIPATLSVYPNPVAFSAQQNLQLKFDNLQNRSAEISIYNLKGQKVHAHKLMDTQEYRWDGKDRHGQRSSAGIYFIKTQVTGEAPVMRKLVIL